MSNKEISNLLKKLRKQGWEVALKNNHYKAFPPDKSHSPVMISATPSDQRAIQNIKSDCKQRGANV